MTVSLDPGIAAGNVDLFPEQHLRGVGARDAEGALQIADLDPVTISEIIRDLTELARN